MRRILAVVLAIAMLIGYVPAINAADEEKEKASLSFVFSDSYNSELVQEKMKVVFINTTSGKEKIIENAEQEQPGKITVELKVGSMYRIELRETKFKLTNSSGIFTVTKNESGKVEARFNSNNFDATRLTVDKWIETKELQVKDNEGKNVKDELKFELRESLRPNLKGDEYTTVNGKLPKMLLLGEVNYILKLKTNDKYEMKDLEFYSYMDGGNPIKMDEKIIDNIIVIKKQTEKAKRTGSTFVDVKVAGESVEDGVNFTLKGNGETKQYTTENGSLLLKKLVEDETYTLSLEEDDKYEMKDIKFIYGVQEGYTPGVDNLSIIDLTRNLIEFVEVKEKKKQEEPADENTVEVYVWDNEDSTNTDGLKFELISSEGSKEYTVEYSNLILNMKEGVQYTLKLKSTDNHMMDDIKCYLKYDNGFRKYFLFGEDNRSITKIVVNKKQAQKPKRKGSKILSVVCEGEDVEEELDFTLENNGVTKPLMTDNSGTILFRGLLQGETYILRLVENEKYEMDPKTFIFDVQDGFDKETGVLDAINPDGSLFEKVELREKGSSPIVERIFEFKILEGSEKGQKIEKNIKVRVRTSNENSQVVDSENGIVKFNIKEDRTYLLSVMDNIDYSLSSLFLYYKNKDGQNKEERLLPNEDKEIEFNYSEGTEHKFVVVVKSKKDNPVVPGKCPSDICRFSDDKVTLKEVPLLVSDGYTTKKPNQDVNFVLFNASRQEYEKEIKSVDGFLPALELYRYDKYILLTKDANYNMFEEYIQANGEGKLPFNNKTHHYVQNIILAEKTNGKAELNRTDVILPVIFNGEKVSGFNVKFISEFETVTEPVVDGVVRAKLLEDIQYSVIVDSEEYSINTLPLTVKDKSEWNAAKYWFDHSSCNSVEFLNLVKRGEENKNATEVICSKGNTKVMGINFKDYMLHTDRRDKSNINEIKDKDADIFVIRLINPHRCEVSKIASGKFTIERKVNKGKVVEKAYLVSKSGDLKEVEFNQKDNLVYVDVDSLSIYDLAFVYKKIDVQKPVEPTPQPQPEPQPPYYGGAGYYEPSPDYLNKDYAKKDDKKEIKKDEKKEEKNIEEVKEEKKVITTKFTLDNKNFASNDMVNMMDVEPFAKDGRIMVPIRFVGMALGFDVSWDQATKTATLTNGKITIKIPMNGKTFYVNDVAYDADAEPEVRHDRIFLSISNIAKALGLEEGKEIFWDQETKTATFIYNK